MASGSASRKREASSRRSWTFIPVPARRRPRCVRGGSALDLAEVAEEIGDVGEEQYLRLESELRVLLHHLLKWDHQPAARSRSWAITVREQRRRVDSQLAKESRPQKPSGRGARRRLRGCARRSGARDGIAHADVSSGLTVLLRRCNGTAGRLAGRRDLVCHVIPAKVESSAPARAAQCGCRFARA
jgi:hypothetical protein